MAGRSRPLILTVEDDKNISRLLALRLGLKGYDVVQKENGPDALELLKTPKRRTPDLIICDVMMPGMEGFEFCRLVREMGLKVPFIFLTARGQSQDKVRGLESGGDDYLTKPFDPHELEAKIAARLRSP